MTLYTRARLLHHGFFYLATWGFLNTLLIGTYAAWTGQWTLMISLFGYAALLLTIHRRTRASHATRTRLLRSWADLYAATRTLPHNQVTAYRSPESGYTVAVVPKALDITVFRIDKDDILRAIEKERWPGEEFTTIVRSYTLNRVYPDITTDLHGDRLAYTDDGHLTPTAPGHPMSAWKQLRTASWAIRSGLSRPTPEEIQQIIHHMSTSTDIFTAPRPPRDN